MLFAVLIDSKSAYDMAPGDKLDNKVRSCTGDAAINQTDSTDSE